MANMFMSHTQLEDNAKSFINEFCMEKSAGTSMIVAGMVSIIQGQESDLERMQNQKWFKRIWYTITGKNKATVKEMQTKRDALNVYLVKIISKLCDMVRTNFVQPAELSSAILTLDNEFRGFDHEFRDMKVSMDKIARTLNDAICSLNTYTFIINDIRNGQQYPGDKPLLSLIDIMSQLDNRTVQDPNRLRQLKETMEKSGFSFRCKVNAREFAEQVFALPEEKIGRILLFCQNLSGKSRFLAYTCNLIKNYFYIDETDRDIVQGDKAIRDSLWLSKLSDGSYCILGNVYTDLKEALPQKFSQLSRMAESDIRKKSAGKDDLKAGADKISVYVIGRKSVGKDDLSHVLKEEYGKFIVKSVNFMHGRHEENREKRQSISKAIQNKEIDCVIYCVDVSISSPKFTWKDEIDIIKSLSKSFPMLIALTYCINKSIGRELADYIYNETGNQPICVLAKEFAAGHDMNLMKRILYGINEKNTAVSAFGVDNLVEEIRSMLGK